MSGEETLQKWLMGIHDRDGTLTPHAVREAARPADSVAHGFVFGLAPADAAEAHYLDRAHKLIQSVRVTVTTRGGEGPKRLRFFIALPGEESGYEYAPLTVLQGNPAKLQAARVEALRRLKQAEDAVSDLDLLAVETPTSDRTAKAVRAVKRARELIEA